MVVRVSVIVAVFNSAQFVREAIKSAQEQTIRDIEIIAIDDASMDDTLVVLRQIAQDDPRVVVMASPINEGPGGARNRGMAVAKGEWIAVLDGDDKFLPNRLATLLDHAETKNLDVLADNHLIYDSHLNAVCDKGFDLKSDTAALTPSLFVLNDAPPRFFGLGLLKPIVRASFLRRHDVRYPLLRFGEDFAFLFSLLLRTEKAALIREPLYVYTSPVGALSGKSSGRSKTDEVSGWRCYSHIAQQFHEDAKQLRADDKLLLRVLDIRKRRIEWLVRWNRARDECAHMGPICRWLFALRPCFFAYTFLKIMRRFDNKHILLNPKRLLLKAI